MLERRTLGALPAKPHTLFVHEGKPASECVFTRDGFSGGFSILYQRAAPTALESFKLYGEDTRSFLGEPVAHHAQPLARRHVQSARLTKGSDFFTARVALYLNDQCRISVLRGKATSSQAFCNGDADELYFVEDGHGELLSMFGRLAFKKHDYILIPRGVPYHFRHQGELGLLCIEGDPYVQIPADFRNPFGQLKLEAPYTHRSFRSPDTLLDHDEAQMFRQLVSLKNGVFTAYQYSHSAAETLGWDGSVYPLAFNIHDYLPKTGKIHLPPNLHLTFQGQDFVVCSFVPRMLDYEEGAVPCPYPHVNVVCDEILFYVSGDFTSRKGVGPGSLSHHPAGLPHGPQPGNYLRSVGAKFTQELAVMIDTWQPLRCTQRALALEDSAYSHSWTE